MSTTERSTAEHRRLAEATGRLEDSLGHANPWYRWGPYLAERAWGTVREDYSASGDAWDFFPHDHARSRAYRWNEDGMAGISDIHHELCMALALWNGRDPILKERMFGLTGPQGNHGEDVKEYWWYLEGLPSHALLKWAYHYPQAAYPYEWLVQENGRRDRTQPEFELMDTGVFDEGRFWSVEVTYAKAAPDDVSCRIAVRNNGPEAATLHVLPTLWFRNTWRWSGSDDVPVLRSDGDAIVADRHALAGYRLSAAPGPDGASPEALFCDNETNYPKLFGSEPVTEYPKDGINDHVLSGAPTVNPAGTGTKAAWWYRLELGPGESAELRLRLHGPDAESGSAWSGVAFPALVERREAEAEEFYAALAPEGTSPERMLVLRQSCAGLVWSKQMYAYQVARWLDGDPAEPPPPEGHRHGRNAGWRHLDSFDILAMPDPWEYPWFASWDLAFHAIPWAHLDPAFAKYQMIALLREWFQHPNGALPGYEWSFDDVNPPVHPLAIVRVFLIDGGEDYDFLERAFQKLLLNYTWWLNRQDPDGNYLFGGGFLGLDNISPVDRSHLPPGVTLRQADGTGWMAWYALGMLAIAVRLARRREVYADMVIKFVEQFALIAEALRSGGLYDEQDGFYYDEVERADGVTEPIRVQSVAGLLPLLPMAAIGVLDEERLRRLGKRYARIRDRWAETGRAAGFVTRTDDTFILAVQDPDRLRVTLRSFFDEARFLSPHGLRAVSREYLGKPYQVPGIPGATVDYEPAESTTAMYGGNSNWRGPIWFPLNYLAIRSFVIHHAVLGPEFTIEYPTGSGEQRTMAEIAGDLADRLIGIFLPGEDGRRPVFGGVEAFQSDPAWADKLLFYEYFHGDNGAGIGAMHQTGWTAVVADLILDPPETATPGAAPA